MRSSPASFTKNTEFKVPTVDRLEVALQARLRDRLDLFDASELARATMGDSIFSNMMVFGGAWQKGLVPVSFEAIAQAIEMNGAAVERNKRAFDIGRWAVLHPEEAARLIEPKVVDKPKTLEEKIAFRADHLVAYQGKGLAKRYGKLLDGISDPALKEAVAKGYHKLLAYKDEYEVARLLLDSRAKAEEAFEGDLKLSYHLAPPMLGGTDPNGRPKKRKFGASMERGFRLLAKLKRLRGTPLDIFGYTEERKMERALIRQYEADMQEWLPKAAPGIMEPLLALAELPLQIRGFGPVKLANEQKAAKRREELLAALRQGGVAVKQAAE